MAQPERRLQEEEPPVDPAAIDRAYRANRARRRAQSERKEETRRARLRFWIALLVLVVLTIAIALTSWREVQRLFGL